MIIDSRRTVAGPASSLAFDVRGQGTPTVVFVHGLGGSSRHWSAQLEHLGARTQAAALDLRGHGESTLPLTDDYSIDRLADDVAAVVERLTPDRLVLVGHGMGARVTLACAARHGSPVAGLVLVDPLRTLSDLPDLMEFRRAVAVRDHVEVTHWIERYWRNVIGRPCAAVVDSLLADLRELAPEAVIGASHGDLERFDTSTAMAHYHGPTLSVLPSGNDHCTGPRTRVIEGTGHWIHLERPAEFNTVLDGFLDRLPRDA